MKVEFTGDKGCYFVDSTDSTTRHKVDILALRGKDMRCNGQCSCRDFETRCSPEWTKSGIIVERDDLTTHAVSTSPLLSTPLATGTQTT